MIFSQTAEYALRAVVVLADGQDQSRTNQQIAAVTRVPAGYLSKVLQALHRAGLVRAQRGIGGGFTLARPAAEITVLEVVNAVDPVQRITKCPLHRKTHGKNLCPLHRKLDDALGLIENAFGSTTLADIRETPSTSKPFCAVGNVGRLAR